MKLTHLRDVLAVAECGSLRAAARHLGIAQPAITRSIREIEHELGAMLFERHARGARLTHIGDVFVRRAVSIQSELRRAREEIDQIKGRMTGQVSVAISAASNIALLADVHRAFRKRFPDALLIVEEKLFQQSETELREGRIDFYVGPLDPNVSMTQLDVEQLFENVRFVVARKSHPLMLSNSLSDLANAQWIRPTFGPRTSEVDFDTWFEKQGLPQPQIVMHCQSTLVAILAVANSDLLTILPRQFLQLAESRTQLERLPMTKPITAAPICIVRRRDLPLTPMAEYLCDQVRKFAALYTAAG